jgi:nucleotide-binding universal stress UspA family protein
VLGRTNHPTLVVADSGRVTDGRYRRVLVAVDLAEGSEHLLRRAVALTAGGSPQLTVMHTVTRLEAVGAVQSPARWTVPEYRAHVLDDARRHLQALVAAVAGGSDAQVRVATGPAADAVLDASAGVDADVIVVGRNRGFRPLGSTALRVLRRNDRALLVIPMAHAESVAHAGDQRAA